MTEHDYLNVLVVARWPLGGIRTYIRYVYRCFSQGYRITLLVPSTREDEALRRDASDLGLRLVICSSGEGDSGLMKGIFTELYRNSYHLIHSQGFTSALAVYPVNLLFRIPHILTVHGILEEKFFGGRTAWLKSRILAHVLGNVDVLYAVSNDMLQHVQERLPSVRAARSMKIVIPNGIDVTEFTPSKLPSERTLRQNLGIGEEPFLFGFLGRFMQQKGFKYLIEALDILQKRGGGGQEFHLLAIGSGDFLDYYQKVIRERGLADRVTFLPFQGSVASIYAELDAVVMPSIWEASGLLAMETLSMGVPLLASDCIGLRETVAGTPTVVFPSENGEALADAMMRAMMTAPKETFRAFAPRARERFDVAHTAAQLQDVMERIVHGRR